MITCTPARYQHYARKWSWAGSKDTRARTCRHLCHELCPWFRSRVQASVKSVCVCVLPSYFLINSIRDARDSNLMKIEDAFKDLEDRFWEKNRSVSIVRNSEVQSNPAISNSVNSKSRIFCQPCYFELVNTEYKRSSMTINIVSLYSSHYGNYLSLEYNKHETIGQFRIVQQQKRTESRFREIICIFLGFEQYKMLIIPLNLDPVLLLLHKAKLAYSRYNQQTFQLISYLKNKFPGLPLSFKGL